MKSKNTLIIALIVGLVLLLAVGVFRQPDLVNAQEEVQSGGFERISFGSVGITSGQTLRVSVSNSIMPNDVNLPPGPIRVTLNFRYLNGNLVRNRSGEAIRRVVDLERGDSAFIDLDYDQLPPSPIRAQIRPVVFSVTPPPIPESGQNQIPFGSIVPTVEVINNVNGRSQFAVFTHPGAARGFNPQPDPPAEP